MSNHSLYGAKACGGYFENLYKSVHVVLEKSII